MVVPPLTTIVWPMIKVPARARPAAPDTGDVCGSPKSHRRFVDLRGGRRYTSAPPPSRSSNLMAPLSDGSPSPPPQWRWLHAGALAPVEQSLPRRAGNGWSAREPESSALGWCATSPNAAMLSTAISSSSAAPRRASSTGCLVIDELVAAHVDVIITSGYPAALAAKQHAWRHPDRGDQFGDPIATGLAARFAIGRQTSPGSRMSPARLSAKRLALLKEAVPSVRNDRGAMECRRFRMTLRFRLPRSRRSG